MNTVRPLRLQHDPATTSASRRAGSSPQYCIDASPAVVAAIVIATLACFGYAIYTLVAHAGMVGTPRLAAGTAHVCRITDQGDVRCRGANAQGELGDGTRTSHLLEVDVTGAHSGVVALIAGAHHTCATFNDGTRRCWGETAALASLPRTLHVQAQ